MSRCNSSSILNTYICHSPSTCCCTFDTASMKERQRHQPRIVRSIVLIIDESDIPRIALQLVGLEPVGTHTHEYSGNSDDATLSKTIRPLNRSVLQQLPLLRRYILYIWQKAQNFIDQILIENLGSHYFPDVYVNFHLKWCMKRNGKRTFFAFVSQKVAEYRLKLNQEI